MPVKIPVAYVPRARIDYEAEQRQILGHPLELSDGFRVPPLTAARLIALELVTSPFFVHPDTCELLDAAAAVVLVSCDRELVQELIAAAPSASEAEQTSAAPLAVAAADPSAARDAQATAAVEGLPSGQHGPSAAYPNLYTAAAAFFNEHGDALVADYWRLVEWICAVPFYGIDMLPKTGKAANRPSWFDGEFVGSIVAPAAAILAVPVDRLLWEIPLCTIGHAVAQRAAGLGVKGIERPPDKAALKRLIAEAEEREKSGLLHPWQYQDPFTYSLTAEQFKANPALGPWFAGLRAAFEQGGHKPLDPDLYPLPAKPETADLPAGEAETDLGGRRRRPLCVADPSDARYVLPTITVQDLSWGPRGPSADNQDISI